MSGEQLSSPFCVALPLFGTPSKLCKLKPHLIWKHQRKYTYGSHWTSTKLRELQSCSSNNALTSHGIPYVQVKETNALSLIVLEAVVDINKVVVFTHKTFWENFYGFIQRSQADQPVESTILHQVSVINILESFSSIQTKVECCSWVQFSELYQE